MKEDDSQRPECQLATSQNHDCGSQSPLSRCHSLFPSAGSDPYEDHHSQHGYDGVHRPQVDEQMLGVDVLIESLPQALHRKACAGQAGPRPGGC